MLDELLDRLKQLPAPQLAQVVKETLQATRGMKWIPNPGPQTQAYHSLADILLYGGEPGGGKTALAVGLAFNEHERSLIMRRQYTDLDSLTDYAIVVNGNRDGYNGSAPPRLTHTQGVIDFGAASKVGDEQHWMGRPHDLLAIDEATQFAAKQIRFLRGWLRSTNKEQRVRTILATNPPLSADGEWVFEWFAPWINPQFPNPAKPGELRWAVFGEDDKIVWVDGSGEYEVDGRTLSAESLTFIPSKLTDNPYYDAKAYQKKLDALPAAEREILLGGFRKSFRDQDRQVIPTAWVTMAQERWTKNPPKGVPMCAMGVDASGGGVDPMIIAARHDGWYDMPVKIPGKTIPQDRAGKHCAGLVISHRHDDATIVIDMGGGYGGPMFEQLRENIESKYVIAHKGAEKTNMRTHDRQMGFPNLRSAAIWKFREALDPSQPGGSPIALPDSPTMVADLTAPTYEVTPRGYKVESKEDVCARLGRSTDEGDAVVMAWTSGAKRATHHREWTSEDGGRRKSISVDLGPRRRHG
jgi:hypothetical protein